MSFLNPVNEPVKRFKNTDAGAPQINYNSRVAGDVKAVLKACLVTGYGAVPSAGWTATNEVSHVVEFVSPSAAFSDYRLSIDDTSSSSTTWYYQYQNSRVNPTYNTATKNFDNANKAHSSNGWQLLVTDKGVIFLELVYANQVSKLSVRITYFGQVKSGLIDTSGNNIMFFNIGHNAAIAEPHSLYRSGYPFLRLALQEQVRLISANPFSTQVVEYKFGISNVDIASSLYITNDYGNTTLGQVVGLLSKTVNDTADMYGATEATVGGRPALSVCAGISYAGGESSMYSYGRTYLIYLDYWEY